MHPTNPPLGTLQYWTTGSHAGEITFTPPTNFVGTTTFWCTVSDIHDPDATGTVTVNVAKRTHTVTFTTDSPAVAPYNPVTVADGTLLTPPATPTAPDVQFFYWYTDSNCTNTHAYDFATPVTTDLNLYACASTADSQAESGSPAASTGGSVQSSGAAGLPTMAILVGSAVILIEVKRTRTHHLLP